MGGAGLSRFFAAFVDRYRRRPNAQPLRTVILGVAPLTGAENQRGATFHLAIYFPMGISFVPWAIIDFAMIDWSAVARRYGPRNE